MKLEIVQLNEIADDGEVMDRIPFGVQAPVCPTCVDELRSRIKKAQP